MTRKAPFWDAVEGRVPLPAAAVALGWELIAVNPDEGTIEVAFTATDAFLNPAGVVQGVVAVATATVQIRAKMLG